MDLRMCAEKSNLQQKQRKLDKKIKQTFIGHFKDISQKNKKSKEKTFQI